MPLSPGIDLAAYRIAQEGLTNAVRHAHASDGAGAGAVRAAPRWTSRSRTTGGGCVGQRPNGGHGLVGIRERVALYGGTVELGASPSGGVRLAVSLPLEEAGHDASGW